MGDLQDHILDAMRSEGRSLADVERAADAAGVPHGRKATVSQRAAILARLYGWLIETPSLEYSSSGAATAPGSGSDDPPPESAPSPSELLEQAVALTGGELVEPTRPDAAASGMTNEEFHAALAEGRKRADQPIEKLLAEPPRPRTKEYRELPDGVARANAQKYWAERDAAEPEPDETEQLRAALTGAES